MEDILENEGSVKKLNTKGCCFLCLRIEDVTRTDDDNFVAECYSMRQLFRYLQIKANSDNKSSNSSASIDRKLIEVNLCKTCQEINGNVAKICQKLEILYLELNYMLECIHTRVTDSAKDSDRVQEYSRRMTVDLEALSQLAFVDKLRKELARKCLKMRSGPIPIIQVTKFKGYRRAFVKQEQPPIEDESDEEMNSDPPSPPSPFLPDYADSEPSPSCSTPEEKEFNPSPEVLELKHPLPSTSSSTEKSTLDATSSSEIQSKVKNKLQKKKLAKSNRRQLPQDVYCSKDETTGIFHCKHCSSSFKSCVGVRWHYLSIHLNLKQKCKICEKMVDLSNITKHEKACRKNTERRLARKNDPKFIFICNHNQCESRFDTNKKLLDHEYHVHRNANRHPCKLCDKKFKEPILLKIHVDGVHLGKRFSCRFCNKSYTSKYQTRFHEKKCTKRGKIKVEPEEN